VGAAAPSPGGVIGPGATGALGAAGLAAKTALVVGHRTATFGELDTRTNRLARALARLGVETGDRVAVVLPNGVEFVETALATAKAGAQIVPVNRHLKADEVGWILSDSGALVAVVHRDFEDARRGAAEQAPGCTVVLVGAAGGPDGPDGPRDYEDLIAAEPDAPLEREGFGSPEYFFYTSGTTGRPRGVARPPSQPGSTPGAVVVAAMWGLTADDVYLAPTPLYHATCAYVFAHLYLGSTVVILPKWDAREWLRLVEQHRVTVSVMVPAHFIRVLEVPDEERRRYDLSSLRLVLHAAAPCPIPVKRRIIEALPSAEIWEFYGASEGGATRISKEEWLDHPGSVGRPWPGTEIRILDAEGRTLGPGETGLIHIRPPAAIARFEYHGDPEKTSGAWRDGAFTVGDVGHIDNDGYLYITDRASDMLIRGGVNIYPAEVERCIFEHPDVVDCAVFGVPDERYGEQVVALVEARRPIDPAAIDAHVRRNLAGFKCPQVIEVVAELPRAPNGKVQKRLLREWWAAAHRGRG
jgi:long-chain acyl-CoA synthetase